MPGSLPLSPPNLIDSSLTIGAWAPTGDRLPKTNLPPPEMGFRDTGGRMETMYYEAKINVL